jgi:hypothetical protein
MPASEIIFWPDWTSLRCVGKSCKSVSIYQRHCYCRTQRHLQIRRSDQGRCCRTSSQRALTGAHRCKHILSLPYSAVVLPHSQNAFAERLGPLGFDCFSMLVVDLLHEFELGVFKSVFKHLIRLLYAINPEWIVVLNER